MTGSSASPVAIAFPGPISRPRRIEAGFEIRRQHGSDLGQCAACGATQRRVSAVRHPARAEHDRLDFVFREHQRRQHESRVQHVAYARLAIDLRALTVERFDVAIERAQRNPERFGQHRAADRTSIAT